MSDATVATAASVVVAIITAVVGPAIVTRVKARYGAYRGTPAAVSSRPRIPARPTGRGVSARLAATLPAATLPAATLPALGLVPRAAEEAEQRRVILREPGPRAVLGRLAEIPPLSRRAVARELFVGRWADWNGVVRDVREGGHGYVVQVDDADGGAALLDFAADQRPSLETLREGDRVRYAGRVTGTEDGAVTLDLPTIRPTGY